MNYLRRHHTIIPLLKVCHTGNPKKKCHTGASISGEPWWVPGRSAYRLFLRLRYAVCFAGERTLIFLLHGFWLDVAGGLRFSSRSTGSWFDHRNLIETKVVCSGTTAMSIKMMYLNIVRRALVLHKHFVQEHEERHSDSRLGEDDLLAQDLLVCFGEVLSIFTHTHLSSFYFVW